MSLTTSEMTPADIAALTGGNRNNGGMFGDGNGAWWIIVLFLFMFCGWGGGFGNNGANSPGFQGYATRADINEGFAINGIDNGIRAIQNGLCDTTYAITKAVNSGFSAAELSRANQQAALMQQLFAMQMQQANCCCETREAIQGVNYNLATQACDTRNQMQQGFCAIQNTLNNNTRDVIDNQNANSRAILDFLTQALDLCAALADDNTGTGAVQIDGNDVVAALDLDLGNAGTVQSFLEILADLLILDDQVADLLFTGIPTGIPVFDDADPQAMGINFLSHKLSPPFLMPFPSQPG